jgi:tetratricopeptide (TPR) repeat protein
MIGQYQAYLKLASQDAEVHYILGRALQKRKKDLPGARAEYQAALKIKPDYSEAREALDSLRSAGAL